MQFTLPFIRDSFQRFNKLVFEGKLPTPCFMLSRARTFVGKFEARGKRDWMGRTHWNYVLRFSTAFDLPQEELEDTILHEMIHFSLRVSDRRDATPHGPNFRAMMEIINERFNRHITVSHDSKGKGSPVLRRASWHIVGVVSFRDGRKGIKVLPRIEQRVLEWNRRVLTSSTVTSTKYYLALHELFQRYPNSTAMKVGIVDEAELNEALKDAIELEIVGNRLQKVRKV
ncbi:MAG: SprT-like domain-containing protein [Bacteroidales bacterium]|nr:SprT-like domain-containing protein [Bacteroidales bacterium]MDY4620082.1 SprT-like domain-containing protein [Alloprevotella sp.]